MEFPIFHLDFLNNRFLIAIIAVLHVMINHPMAVGGMPLVTLLEWKGYRARKKDPEQARQWDRLAYKILFVFFVITTTVGALTGVGIWFSASLVNPMAIGSLIRVFFWAWFTEWIVFVIEVCLILFYFLSWKTFRSKRGHIRVGVILTIASWVTMAIITAILGFMMDPGNWQTERSFFHGFMNPLYTPQLAFRTPLAMVMGGACGLFLVPFFLRGTDKFRALATGTISRWTLFWTPFLVAGAFLYYKAVPDSMLGNLPVANSTQSFANWYNGLLWLILISAGCVGLVTLVGAFRRIRLPALVSLVPFLLLLALLGHFERVREFIRKPYAIGEYLYANAIRVEDYPLLQKEGLLAHSTYAQVKEITPENRLRAGKEVFTIACSRCHTINGINSIRGNLATMYGDEPWQESLVEQYLGIMHRTRGYMPPFPGNDQEKAALAAYLVWLQSNGDRLPGAQRTGINLTGN